MGFSLDAVDRYYSEKVESHGATAAGADWRDQASQDLRFSELAKITRSAKSGSLLDVGCGWGAFAIWAHQQGYALDYTGYDISDAMLKAAAIACRSVPDVTFRKGSSNFETCDWAIASGIFNVRFETPDSQWRSYVDETIDQMAAASRLGFAFNCLTGFSDADRKVSRLYYPYPGEMLDAVMRRYGRHAMLTHNTGLYEFTIMVWK